MQAAGILRAGSCKPPVSGLFQEDVGVSASNGAWADWRETRMQPVAGHDVGLFMPVILEHPIDPRADSRPPHWRQGPRDERHNGHGGGPHSPAVDEAVGDHHAALANCGKRPSNLRATDLWRRAACR